MNVNYIVEEILDDWFGPNGQVWCRHKKKFVDPNNCTEECGPECITLGPHENRMFRYVQEDDYKIN